MLQCIPSKRRNHLRDATLMGKVIKDKPRRSLLLDPFKLIDVAFGSRWSDRGSMLEDRADMSFYILYAFALVSRGLDLMFRRRNAMVEFTFFIMLSM